MSFNWYQQEKDFVTNSFIDGNNESVDFSSKPQLLQNIADILKIKVRYYNDNKIHLFMDNEVVSTTLGGLIELMNEN